MREHAEDNADRKDLPDALNHMLISCPHCQFEFKFADITYTMKNGFFQCPICAKKFPDPSINNLSTTPPLIPFSRILVPVLAIVGVVIAGMVLHLMMSTEKTPPETKAIVSVNLPSSKAPSPHQTVVDPPVLAVSPVSPATKATSTKPITAPPDKMQIIRNIAAKYHATHTYTMAEGFVCLDMAIDVWNQLKTHGIKAKIMGGILTESIITWNFQQLALEGNHAWVIAFLSPKEKVAIETTEGRVITPEMENASVYFRGIAFETPAEVKKFEFYRRKTYETCMETKQLVKDWNENVSGKQHERRKYEEIIARKSHIGIRAKECEYNFNQLKEFESKAIFY